MIRPRLAGFEVTGDNIEIGNMGQAADTGIIRIGTEGTQTQCYLAGMEHGDGSYYVSNALSVYQITNGLSAGDRWTGMVSNIPVTYWNSNGTVYVSSP